MTLTRNCFSRVAGAYIDEEGFVDGTFNIHFQKLTKHDQTLNLSIAKAIPFSKSNTELLYYAYKEEDEKAGSIWQLLMGICDCELKNDALLDILYDVIGENYDSSRQFAIYVFHGSYDIPLKATDKESLWESEEVYKFLICAVCPFHGDYEVEKPEFGFLFPAFTERSSDIHGIDIFQSKLCKQQNKLIDILTMTK